jgi:hypothetical protein
MLVSPKVQLLKPDDIPIAILHQHDFIAGLFADVLIVRVPKPDRKRLARSVVDDLYGGHIRSPSFTLSVAGDCQGQLNLILATGHGRVLDLCNELPGRL